MTAIVVLFLAGILLLAIEVFVPGMVVGIIGSLSIIAGVVTAFILYGAGGGTIALLSGGLLLGLTLYIEFVVHTTLGGTSQPAVAELAAVLNQQGETVTPLSPSGYVSLQGRQYEAFSQSGYLAKGVTVHVTGLDNFRLIVTQTNPPTSS